MVTSVRYSPFYPSTTFDGVGGTTLPTTRGATWGVDVSNIPANLFSLTGTEEILNSSLLATISNDNVLSINEKFNLINRATQLETAYQAIFARATVLGVDTSGLTLDRYLWNYLLNTYNPSWNDTAYNTTIYTPTLAGTKADDWSAWDTGPGGGTPVFTLNGAYLNINDNSNTIYCFLDSGPIPVTAAQNLTMGVAVKKTTGVVTWSMLRILVGSIYVSLAFETTSGNSFTENTFGASVVSEVLDLGSEYFYRITFNNTPGTDIARFHFYPVVGVASTSFPGFSNTATGSIDVLGSPVAVVGNWFNSGRFGLVGRYNDYTYHLQNTMNAISAVDSSISNYVDGPSAANVIYDNSGTTIQQTVDLLYYLRTGTGGQAVPAGVAMTYEVLDGNLNGHLAGSAPQTLPFSSGTGILTVTSMTSDITQLKINVVYAGITRTFFTMLNRILTPAAPPAGGGSTGSGVASQNSGFLNITSNYGTPQVISNTLTFTTATGQTSVNVQIVLNVKMAKTADGEGPWNTKYKVQRNISGTWTDQGTPVSTDPDPYIFTTDGEENLPPRIISAAGSINTTINITGLTANTANDFRILCYLDTVDNVNTFAYPTNGAALSQIVPVGGGISIS
jgi:hypothetical protein